MREGVTQSTGQSWKAFRRRATQTDSKALGGEGGRAFQHLGMAGSQAKALQVGLSHTTRAAQ